MQMLAYQRALDALGVKVTVTTETKTDFEPYDLIHLFNLDRPLETFSQMRRAKRSGKAVVLSSIHQARRFVEAYERAVGGVLTRNVRPETLDPLKDLARVVRGYGDVEGWCQLARKGTFEAKREILTTVDAVLLLAEAERGEILDDFGVIPRRTYVVYNGYEEAEHRGPLPPDLARALEPVSDYVLSVGRIEAGKNQLAIIRSLVGSGLPLVFVGSVNPWHKGYVRRFEIEVAKHRNVYYLGWVEPQFMPAIYERARVHVLASWFEVAPLVDLEAAGYGCQVVTTTRSYAAEYASDFALFCEPNDEASIRSAVLDAYERGRNREGARIVRERFTWRKAGLALLQAYEEILRQGANAPLA